MWAGALASTGVAIAAVLAGASVLESRERGQAGEAAAPGGPPGSVAGRPDFVVHEWGTFTTVSGSDGGLLPGLQKEEEALPYFVYSHAGMGNFTKGFNRPLRNVTVKMETPVLYFYADNAAPFPVHVGVGFDGGAISQWFPQRTSGEELPGLVRTDEDPEPHYPEVDFAAGYQGSIAWDIEVLPKTDANDGLAFRGGETLTWVYPRQVDANVVRTPAGEHEKYLFYRGVGRFGLPVRFSAAADGRLRIDNTGSDTMPSALVFSMNDQGEAGFRVVGPVEAGADAVAELGALGYSRAWQRGVYDAMTGLLVEAGLFRREADAMVQTWWTSYFERPGTRVFWIVPRRFTDQVLPLAIEPAPRAVERVLVGRAEVMTPAFEAELLAARDDEEAWKRWLGDRYFDAYQARLDAIVASDPASGAGQPKVAAADAE